MNNLNDSGFYQLVNSQRTSNPKSVEGLNNSSFFYYYRKLLKMAYSIFDFSNIPDNWDLSYFKENLFLNGYICVTDTAAGIVPLRCDSYGLNIYGHPTNFRINNPVLGSLEGKIDVNGVLIYMSMIGNNYIGINDLIERYATLLAEVDGSLQTTLINSRIAHVFSASSEAQMKTMKKTYDKISAGEPAVFIRKNPDESNDHVLFNNVKQSYIGQELLDTKRTILNEFMSEIGINNANTQKKERLITDEVTCNKSELNANIFEWYSNIKNGIEKVNNMYNLNIEFNFNEDVLNAWQMDGGVQL